MSKPRAERFEVRCDSAMPWRRSSVMAEREWRREMQWRWTVRMAE
jgi:hypothetical protein